MAERHPGKSVVVTLAKDGAACVDAAGQFTHQPAFEAETVGRIGGGDAFAAGYLFGHLRGYAPAVSLKWGAAAAALKYSMPGDMPLIDLAEVEQLVNSQFPRPSDLVR